ncbi:MAG: anthranilate synthase component I family protein [Rhodoglobus sp.]
MRPLVLRHPLRHWVDPAAAFVALHGASTDVVWLDTGANATTGASYIGAASRVADTFEGSVFDFLRADLAEHALESGADGFQLGWVGWLGYELRFETLGQPRNRESRYPDAALIFVDRAIEFDHASQTVTLLALASDWAEAAAWRDATIAALDSAAPPAAAPAPAPATAVWRYPDADYLAMVDACKAAITEGEAYQLCLTTEATVDVSPDPVATYLALRASSPSHHGALLRIGPIALLSSSPEQFLTVSPDGVVESRPIKGTRRRGATVTEDEALRDELESSDKERAENLMIVDLMRNDIARVSEIGSVEVTSLLAVESYAQVHQLVSTVRGRLAPDIDALDAVAVCFPAGSMTGAPKYSATMILDGLEQRARGIYAGAFGYFGLNGRVDLAMVIRSIVIDEHGSTVGSGGGITALSVPVEELEEVRIKAAALLAVLGAGDVST